MARKHHAADEIVAKLRQVELLMSQGKSTGDAVRASGRPSAPAHPRRMQEGVPGSRERSRDRLHAALPRAGPARRPHVKRL